MLSHTDDRVQRILATVDSIPPGKVSTYGQVARHAGLPRNARLVGKVLRDLPAGHELPWYRVLGACGMIRVEGATAARQARLLKAEGVTVRNGRVKLAEFGLADED